MIIYLLKFLTLVLRTFTKNSGTALPGLLLEKYFPKTLQKLLTQFEKVVLITGTNGKTTTAQMVCYLLEQENVKYISNTSGSNLIRGIASVVLDKTKGNKVTAKLGIFEVEEATMPKLVKYLRPDVIVVTNIFRDQLDAYGEIDKTLKYIKQSIEDSNNPKLILNGDDSRVASLAYYSNSEIDLVHLDPRYLQQIKFEDTNLSDIPQTVQTNKYQITILGIQEDLGTNFNLTANQTSKENLAIQVPGIHNVINASLAIVAVEKLGIQTDYQKLRDFPPAFGRGEIIRSGDTSFQLLLAKNPAGMNLNLHLLENVKNPEAVLLVLNDKIADGRDVSWIWDVDFGLLREIGFKRIFVAGTRKWDMAIRMKYENIAVEKVFETIDEAVDELKNSDQKVFVLPTYTAMREFRGSVSRYTKVKEIWE